MFLSRIKLDGTKKHTQIAMASPSKIHGAIEESFPRMADRRERNRKLWRIDRYNGEIFLLLLSEEKPDLSGIVRQFCKGMDDVESKCYDALFDRVVNDSMWRFRLVANPTKSLKRDGQRGKVVAHITPKHQIEWLKRQSEKYGFEILPAYTSVTASGWRIFKKRNEREIRLLEAAFEGILVVKDSEMFMRALKDGIGREKAYGMGLLTIMSVK